MKIIHRYCAILFAAITILSCSSEKEVPDKGQIQFSFNSVNLTNGRTLEEDVTSLIISIESESGELVLDQQEVSIAKFGSEYISEPVLLEIGSYDVTKFLVLNSGSEIVYATPVEGSILAGLVDHPLPVSFDIASDQITEISIEVIATASHDPEDLGYSTFSFDIIPIQEILISVINQDSTGSYFVEADVTVYGDSDSLYTKALGDSINIVPLRTDFEEVKLKFSAGDQSQVIVLPADTLAHFRTVPLTVVFSGVVDITSNLVAYYPFSGNANDASGNDLHGTVQGAALSADRNNSANSAYEFTDDNDVILVSDNNLLDINNELTLSVWINLYSGNISGSRIIDKIISGTGTGFLLDIYNENNTIDQKNTIRFVGTEGVTTITAQEVTTNEWNHIAVTYSSGEVKIYLNGELILVTQEEATALSTTDEYLQIGNDIYGTGANLYDPFRGKIDDIRIYGRTLNPQEINALYGI